MRLRLSGTHVGAAGPVTVVIDDVSVGRLAAAENRAAFDWTPSSPLESPPRVTFAASDEGTWFVPERIELLVPRSSGGGQRLATWQMGMGVSTESSAARLHLPLAWSVADLPAAAARLEARDTQSAGRWRNRLGSRGAWIPAVVAGDVPQGGFHVEVLNGQVFQWPDPQGPDGRALEHPKESGTHPTCWFADDRLSLRIAPPDAEPYRLTLYVLDFDRNGRALEIALSDEFVALSSEQVSVAETAGGVYLTWTASGTLNVELKKKAGFNAVLSGLFLDPAVEKGK
jgi:hypothetical protein